MGSAKPISCIVCEDAIETKDDCYVLVGVSGGMYDFVDRHPHLHLTFFSEMEVDEMGEFVLELKLFPKNKKIDYKSTCHMKQKLNPPEKGASFMIVGGGVLDVYDEGTHDFEFKYRIDNKAWKVMRKIKVRYSSSETSQPS